MGTDVENFNKVLPFIELVRKKQLEWANLELDDSDALKGAGLRLPRQRIVDDSAYSFINGKLSFRGEPPL